MSAARRISIKDMLKKDPMSGPPRKAVVKKDRTVHMYSELWHASGCVLRSGIDEPRGSSWQFLSSIILSAFAFEAYLNLVGEQVFACWTSLERLNPLDKLNLLSEHMEATFSNGKGERPLQTVIELFNFRNTIAHGSTKKLKQHGRRRDLNNSLDDYLGKRLTLEWERLIQTKDFAERVRTDVEEVLAELHRVRPEPKEFLFTFGISFSSAAVEAQAESN